MELWSRNPMWSLPLEKSPLFRWSHFHSVPSWASLNSRDRDNKPGGEMSPTAGSGFMFTSACSASSTFFTNNGNSKRFTVGVAGEGTASAFVELPKARPLLVGPKRGTKVSSLQNHCLCWYFWLKGHWKPLHGKLSRVFSSMNRWRFWERSPTGSME